MTVSDSLVSIFYPHYMQMLRVINSVSGKTSFVAIADSMQLAFFLYLIVPLFSDFKGLHIFLSCNERIRKKTIVSYS